MQILHSMKDFKKIILSLIQTPDFWIRSAMDIMDRPLKGCQETGTYTRLTDGSYGQFALSRNNDVLVYSVGKMSLFGKMDIPHYADEICIYFMDEFGVWHPICNFAVEDYYPVEIAFEKNTSKRIAAKTQLYMKKFASIIDSQDKVKNLVKSFEEKF